MERKKKNWLCLKRMGAAWQCTAYIWWLVQNWAHRLGGGFAARGAQHGFEALFEIPQKFSIIKPVSITSLNHCHCITKLLVMLSLLFDITFCKNLVVVFLPIGEIIS